MMTETPMTETPMTETPMTTPSAATAPSATLLVPQFATTAKRGTARKVPKEPSTLLAYAVEHGGRIELSNPTVKQDLATRGLPSHRIPNAAYGVRKFFGKQVVTERSGRAVTAYTISL